MVTFMEYAWLIPLVPLMAFVVVGFFGTKFKGGGGFIAVSAAIFAFAMSALVSYEFFTGSGTPYSPIRYNGCR